MLRVRRVGVIVMRNYRFVRPLSQQVDEFYVKWNRELAEAGVSKRLMKEDVARLLARKVKNVDLFDLEDL